MLGDDRSRGIAHAGLEQRSRRSREVDRVSGDQRAISVGGELTDVGEIHGWREGEVVRAGRGG